MRHRSNTVLIHDGIDKGLSPRCSRLAVETFCIDKYFLRQVREISLRENDAGAGLQLFQVAHHNLYHVWKEGE